MSQEQSSQEASCGTRPGEDYHVSFFCLGASRATFAPSQPQERTLRLGWVDRSNRMESLSRIYKCLPPMEQKYTDKRGPAARHGQHNMPNPSIEPRQRCKRDLGIEQRPSVGVRRCVNKR